MKTLIKPRHFLLLPLVALACLSAVLVSTDTRAAKTQAAAMVRAAGRGRPFLNLRDGRSMVTTYGGDETRTAALAGNSARS